MSDDLRTKIATVLYARAMSRLAWHRAWDDLQPDVQQMWLDDADAVIRELGLTQQEFVANLNTGTKKTRYVTEWTTDG